MKISSLARPLAILGILVFAAGATAQEMSVPADDSQSQLLAQTAVQPRIKFSLTPEQLEKIGALKDQMTLDTATKKAQLQVSKHQLRGLLAKPSVNKQEALALQAKINALQGDLANARLGFKLAAGDILTPEQKEQFSKRMMFGGFGGGRGCGGGFKRHHGGRGFQKHGGPRGAFQTPFQGAKPAMLGTSETDSSQNS
jgi:Spy/CpxP family protein refolding chaperone